MLPIFVGAALLLTNACNRPTESLADITADITIEHEISPQPVRAGTVTVTLKLTDDSRKAVNGAQVIIEGNMSHAGMAPVFATAKEIEPGRYQAPLELSMAGDWIVLVHLTLSNGKKVERQFEIRGVREERMKAEG